MKKAFLLTPGPTPIPPQVALKEAKESQYWLALVGRASLLPSGAIDELAGEADALVRILAKSVVTAKGRK